MIIKSQASIVSISDFGFSPSEKNLIHTPTTYSFLVSSSRRFLCFQFIAICFTVGIDYEQGMLFLRPALMITDPANPRKECHSPNYLLLGQCQ